MLFKQPNGCNSCFMYSADIHRKLVQFLLTEYDTHGKTALNSDVVLLSLRFFTPNCE